MELVVEESEVIVVYSGPIQFITFNRPQRRNALTSEAYYILRKALQSASENDDIKITFVTGSGDYFSSGNDFGQSMTVSEDLDTTIRKKIGSVRDFVHSLIDYSKILIALVNGPAIGIAVTILPLFDLVYAFESATFQTPFSSLGITAEGCSTYTFSRCLGKSLAAKMLYFNHTMNSKEAKDCGFVADILSDKDLPSFMDNLYKLGELPLKSLVNIKQMTRVLDFKTLHHANSLDMNRMLEKLEPHQFFQGRYHALMYTKQMTRSHDLKSLHYANSIESEKLVEMFQSEDFMKAFMKLRQRKGEIISKL